MMLTDVSTHSNMNNGQVSGLPLMPPCAKEAIPELPPVIELARRRLFRRLEGRENLAAYSAMVLSQTDTLPADVQKSNSIAKRLFSWMANTRIAVWTVKHMLRSTRFYMTLGSPTKWSKNQLDQTIEELSGSKYLVQVFHFLSPIIADAIQKRLVTLDLHGSLDAFLKGEHYSLTMFFDAIIPAMYVNIAKSIKESSPIENTLSNKPITLVDVLNCLCEMVNAHLPHINARIEAIEKIPDPIKRERKLCNLFAPLVEDFLLIAFPEGANELPLTKMPVVSKYLWTSIQKHLLPLMFVSLHRQFASPLNMAKEKKSVLLNTLGGDSLVSLAELAGEKAGETIPTLFLTSASDTQLHSPWVNLIAEKFSSLFDGTELTRKRLEAWLGEQLIDLGKSENGDIKKLWILLGGYLEPLLIHSFFYMSQVPISKATLKGRLPDALGIIVIKFFGLCSHFFNNNHKAIQERIVELKYIPIDPESDEVLLDIFRPFAEELLAMMGLTKSEDWPIPSFIRGTAAYHLKAALPQFLLKQYFVFTNSKLDNTDTHNKLSSLLFDPKNLESGHVATSVISALHAKGNACAANMFNEFYKKLWQESGTERIVQTLEGMCSVFAKNFVNSLLTKYGVSAQRALKEETNPFMKRTLVFLKSQVEAMLLEILVKTIETTAEKIPVREGDHPKQLLLVHVIMRLTDIIDNGLKNAEQKFQAAEKFAHNPRLYDQEVRKIFTQMAADIHAIGGRSLFNHLPLTGLPAAESVREVLSDALKEALLPDLLYVAYTETTNWQRDLQKSLDELEHCYHTTHPVWGCRVLAQYASDYIKHYFTTSNDDAAKLLLASLQQYIVESKESNGDKLVADLKDPASSVDAIFRHNISHLGKSEDAKLSLIWPVLTRYIEAIIAKFMAEISKTIHQIEAENPDFIMDIAITMLKDTAEHFEVINRVTEESGDEQGFNINSITTFAAFGTHLHDGVPFDPKASSEEKDRTRLEGYFNPLADKLLKLANLSINDFPLPLSIRQQVGELLIEKILPLVLLNADQKALEHDVRDTLMLNFVQTLYQALNAFELSPPKNDLLEEAKIQLDPNQKRLHETCGALVLELVKLIPDTMVQYVFMKEKVKNMSAEAIGDAIMPYLSKWTLLQIIDTMIFHGLPSFHPARWEGKVTREVLVPRKAFLRPDGKMELKPVKKFKFVFPKTTAEIKTQETAKELIARQTRTQLRNGFTRTISSQLRSKMGAFIKTLWDNLQAHLDDFIEGQFPDRGPKIKAFFDKVGRRVFFDVFGTIFQFLFSPFIKILTYVVEKIYIDKRSDDIIENLHSDALENLIYKWIDTVLDALDNPKRNGVIA